MSTSNDSSPSGDLARGLADLEYLKYRLDEIAQYDCSLEVTWSVKFMVESRENIKVLLLEIVKDENNAADLEAWVP